MADNYLIDDPTIYKCKKCNAEFTEDEIEVEEESDE
jgi:DNA-directed RNA polymerase subunit RPC12/RpoP